MTTSNLKSLIGRLNKVCHTALEAAAGLCLSRTHYEVDVEHLLSKLLDADHTDLHRIARHYDIDSGRLQRDLVQALDGFKTGNSRTPVLSPRIPKLIEQAWLLASVDYGHDRVRSGHLLLALLKDPELARLVKGSSRELDKISVEELGQRLPDLAADSVEQGDGVRLTPAEAELPGAKTAGVTALEQYTVDLCARARAGNIDPVLGREEEIRQMIDILMRRRQNNPILTGEAGVGKTAVVEGLALRVARQDVPPPLQGVVLRTLDLGLLQAGASVKGEFENRLKSVITEVKSSPQPIILFIDEAHTMIGAGGAAGQSDAANLLKPALARGELRTVAATTWSEYKKYFEKDAALARRFQVIKIDEPNEDQAVVMLRGLADKMEAHHQVRVMDRAVVDAVRLSHRYLSGRQLPDKAVSVLDTACARVAMSQTAVPAAVEDTRRRLENMQTELRVLDREAARGVDHEERIRRLQERRAEAEARLAELEQRWAAEKELAGRIGVLLTELEASVAPPTDHEKGVAPADPQASRAELEALAEELAALQGETPLLQVCVDGQTVAQVISAWTGIPVGKMVKDEIDTVRGLKDLLERRVIGQSHALDMIAQRIRTSRAGLEDPGKPTGVFLLVGPSGVGKTETALVLADLLYGGERNVIGINMSEYQEAHTVSGLKGSPPGYVGYGEGGVLTEAVRRKPYSVVLLDEVEKAHPDVMELFYQVFDKGVLDDAEGRQIDFKNTVIVLTSNLGTDTIMRACAGAEETPPPDAKALTALLRQELRRHFKPAFLGRLIVIPYYPISDQAMRVIIKLKLNKVRQRFRHNHRAEVVYDEALVDEIAKRCTEVETGARNVDHILTGNVLPQLSDVILAQMAAGNSIERLVVSVPEAGKLRIQVN